MTPLLPSAARPRRTAAPTNALTVDVEDWFQVHAFEDAIPRGAWDRCERRVEASTGRLLETLAGRGVRATFFVLGWVAERHPALVAAIADAGHEVASHGYDHRRVDRLDPESFRADLRRASDAIGAACGRTVRGFRAPSFSVSAESLWAFDVLFEEGYRFSSSVFPVRHDRYGIPSFPRRPVRVREGAGRALWEFPMTTWRLFGQNLPAAGGGWMRFLPPAAMRRAIASENRAGRPAVVYLHPWEVDPEQPRVAAAARFARWRHYLNLDRTRARLEGLLDRFRFGTVSEALRLEAPGRDAPVAACRASASPLLLETGVAS
jgi:polysaccharide deacetylase family protein (PEP-CTERM system associated)